MGRGTQTEAAGGATLLYGAPIRRGEPTPVDRVADLARRKPEIAWSYLVDLIARRRLSREEERKAVRVIAAADVEALYSGIGTEPAIAHIAEEAWREERDYIGESWPDYLLSSAVHGSAKPEDPGEIVFHRPTIGPEGFGPVAVLSMPSPADDWLSGLSDRRRQTLASCLAGNLEETPLGAWTRSHLVEFILDAPELRSASSRGIAGRLVWAQQIFGRRKVEELDEREFADLEAGVAQDLLLSIGYMRETWAEVRMRVARGNGARAAAEIFIRRVMHCYDEIEPGHVYATFTPEQRKSVGEAFFAAGVDEFRPFFEDLKHAVSRRIEERF